MSDRIWFVNPVERKKMAAKKKKRPTRRNEQMSLGLGSRAMVLHRGGPGTMPGRAKPKKASKAKKPAAKKRAASHTPRASTMAKKKKKRPKAVYKASRRGTRRRTVAIKGPVFKSSKRGKRRRVTRVNPKRRASHRRRNPGMPVFASAALAVLGGFATGVAIRVGTHMAAPGSANAAKIGGAIGALAGIAMAAKMSNPMFGIGIAVGAIDAALQNDAVFKAEMVAAPQTTQKALGAITYQNMAAIENARSIPGYAKMGALPAYARMNAIVADHMAGYAGGNAMGDIASMRVTNPFDR